MCQICRQGSRGADWQDGTQVDAEMNSDARRCSPGMAETMYCTAYIQITVSALYHPVWAPGL